MANVLTVVWFVIAYLLAQTCMMVWAALMFPDRVQRARERVETRPVASLFKGLLFWGVSIFLAIAFLKEGNPAPLQFLGWLVIGPMLAGSALGGGALAEIVAERIRRRTGSEATMPSLVGGAFFTTAAGLMPLVGWFVFFPIVSLIAVGAGFPSLFRPKKTKVAAQPIRLEEFAPVTGSNPYQIPSAPASVAYEGQEMARS